MPSGCCDVFLPHLVLIAQVVFLLDCGHTNLQTSLITVHTHRLAPVLCELRHCYKGTALWRACLSVCLSVCCMHIWRTTRPTFTKFIVHVSCDRSSAIFWRCVMYFRFCRWRQVCYNCPRCTLAPPGKYGWTIVCGGYEWVCGKAACSKIT